MGLSKKATTFKGEFLNWKMKQKAVNCFYHWDILGYTTEFQVICTHFTNWQTYNCLILYCIMGADLAIRHHPIRI